ncbi:MAG: glycoside hydrolase family 3 C-terminal domain-containing protein [Actinomyces sp.]|jgi:beta-glucosidase|nr:glycoside hydrolase family 3 protein [Actinomyces sp.]MCI1641890.1 glycoside hydrolase family 3 C-terminal domain-containing protein [Actinomyces sp.]MCI1661903.1 glycoside hydrolase family 3 C-terminal domain-containing protein [Actinomyces sp.]MCI1691265.1 glycoside hydrolase family 3 C-terminal domain-containing protein [Actinomyces sp.]MCI1787706.1 glycoside hydrolase family 3 C-terminal domain-containing protein [Actinomyces sp.]MCI1830387.1 glycoside hydrolase family 3 C-terminal doma
MNIEQLLGGVLGRPVRDHFPTHDAISREIAADGIVLLRNEDDVLPIEPAKVALFGAGAGETATCGTGSGYVFATRVVTVADGLRRAGFRITSDGWLKRFAAESARANRRDRTLTRIDRMWSGLRILIDDIPVTEADLDAASGADTAIYVVRRNAGEGGDRKAVPGDYYLSDVETANIRAVSARFARTIVVLNTTVIDTAFLDEIPGIDAVVLLGLAGSQAGNALADVLTGAASPDGRLTDTWARRYEDYPASATFSGNDGDANQEDYTEDVFVGYRYFDAFGVDPAFPFGFGLGYTDFALSSVDVVADPSAVGVSVDVTNTGQHSGKQVVQVYVTAPEGRLTKPPQELKGFAKTRRLVPGESERVEITFDLESLASFDAAASAFILEPGDYIVRVGEHSRSTVPAAILRVDDEATVRTVTPVLQPDRELATLSAPPRPPETPAVPVIDLAADNIRTIDGRSTFSADAAAGWFAGVQPHPEATLRDVHAGTVTLNEFVASLDPETLVRLVTGNANETPYEVPARPNGRTRRISAPSSSGSTTGLFARTLAIPPMLLTDGPAGIHIPGVAATGFPVGVSMAQTWNPESWRRMGQAMARELTQYNYSVILGPGMNIHRDPLCGRNFEYYSEDPLLTGRAAAATTAGVQSVPGANVAIKHFACNNQEDDRFTTNATVSPRALREIYLKGFELCVRESDPATVMTSYNRLNGTYTSSHRELLGDVLRGEWGFRGAVMTDWGTRSDKVEDLKAGNDLIMGGYRTSQLIAALEGLAPEFAPNGYVMVETFKVYGGFTTEVVEHWNAFEPSAAGPDEVTTRVARGAELHAKVCELAEQGIARIDTDPDGTRVVTYRGTDRGARLSLDELRACAAGVLRVVLRSASWKLVEGTAARQGPGAVDVRSAESRSVNSDGTV